MKTPDWLTLAEHKLNPLAASPPDCLLLLDPQRENAQWLARALIAASLCQSPTKRPCRSCQSCHLLANETHPDCLWLAEPASIEMVRSLIHKTALTPSIAQYRMIFLGQIDQYNDYALNALLKTLEEPSPHTRFILSASNRRAVRPTILSRARLLAVPQPSPEQARHWLIAQGWSEENATQALLRCHNNPYLTQTQPNNASENEDPLSLFAEFAAFCAEPKTHTGWLNRLDEMSKERVLDVLTLNLEQLIYARQLGELPERWRENPKLAHILHSLDVSELHRVYARLCALRQPGQRQSNLPLNAKVVLLDLFDSRIKPL